MGRTVDLIGSFGICSNKGDLLGYAFIPVQILNIERRSYTLNTGISHLYLEQWRQWCVVLLCVLLSCFMPGLLGSVLHPALVVLLCSVVCQSNLLPGELNVYSRLLPPFFFPVIHYGLFRTRLYLEHPAISNCFSLPLAQINRGYLELYYVPKKHYQLFVNFRDQTITPAIWRQPRCLEPRPYLELSINTLESSR